MLNKAIYLESIICFTKGWYLVHGYHDEKLTPGEQLRIEEGKHIGELARTLYPSGILFSEHGDEAVKKSNQFIHEQEAAAVLFEAAFSSGKYSTRADILIRENNSWHLIEVKSVTNFADKSKREQDFFIDDMAYTLMVIGTAIPVEKVSIMSLSKDYRLGMSLQKFFVLTDVTELVQSRMEQFNRIKNDVVARITPDELPNPNWIYACKDCEFFKTECLGKDIKNPVFNLPRINEKKCNELFETNCFEISSIPLDFKLTHAQERVRKAAVTDEVYISAHFKNEIHKIEWPAYYLDFETIKTAYPLYSDVAPHEQVLTQYSLHKLNSFEVDPAHVDFLADPKRDCRRELAEHLIEHIGDKGSIIVYSSFEKTMLNGLKARFPDLDEKVTNIINRLIDLKQVIQNHYYHCGFRGSYSIKKVLPILVPEMSYEGLDIKNGDEAIVAFVRMARDNFAEKEIEKIRRQLLEYCCQDTMAMLVIHKKLHLLAD